MAVKEVNIVVKGQWNTSIFTPNWVFKNVLKVRESDVAEVGIDGDEFKIVFKIDNITLVPNANHVEFKITDYSQETLEYAGNCCIQLLQMLPHTNKVAVGLNYKHEPSSRFEKNLELTTIDDYDVSQITYKKTMDCCQLNVLVDSQYTLFNYHYSKPQLFQPEHIFKYLTESEMLWRAL